MLSHEVCFAQQIIGYTFRMYSVHIFRNIIWEVASLGKRVFLLVLDSFGIGDAPDAALFGDAGSNTLLAVHKSEHLHIPHLKKLGLYNITGLDTLPTKAKPLGHYARLQEKSLGKDTTIGHWEIAGVISEKALPTFPNGFPKELIHAFEKQAKRKVLCNKPASGTQVIAQYGEEHMKTGALIVYTSADSVFQIAANEAVVPLETLYHYCELARTLLQGDLAVGRVIARPFIGTDASSFQRTPHRHDFSLPPPQRTVLEALQDASCDVIAVGKIFDIFAGRGITERIPTQNNAHGMQVVFDLLERDFHGLAFVNLVDFDMLYGHRNDVHGYAKALSAFDIDLGHMLPLLQEDDVLIITADHGCDPSTTSTDHSREDVPFLLYQAKQREGQNLGVHLSFSCIANTLAELFSLPESFFGESLLP